MNRCILLLFLFALPAFAQKNMYEMKWGSQGNGGGSWTTLLMQPPEWNPACIYMPGPGKICVNGAHGNLHVMDFGTGPFLIDDEGYIFQVLGANYGLLVWTSAKRPGDDLGIREFANGVH